MRGFVKQTFIVLVLVLLVFGGSTATKCVSVNNQPFIVRPMLTDLNTDELHRSPFIISLDRCNGSFSTVQVPFGRICAPKKKKDVNLKVFNMIKEKKNGIMISVIVNVKQR